MFVTQEAARARRAAQALGLLLPMLLTAVVARGQTAPITLQPSSVEAGSPGFTLRVTISGEFRFGPTSRIAWNGQLLGPPTTLLAEGRAIEAPVPAALVASAGTVEVRGTNAANPNGAILGLTDPATFTIRPAAPDTLTVSPLSLTFAPDPCGSPAAAQNVAIGTGSGTSRPFTATRSAGATWLLLNGGSGPVSGSTPASLAVSVDTAGLNPGVYNGSIAITATGVTNSPQTVQVSLTVTAPALLVSPVSLAFSTASGGPAPAAQNVSVTTSCQDARAFTATPGAAWLRLNGGTAAVSGSTPASVAVGIDASGLAPGIHSALVTISAPGLSGSPRTVEVTLTVTAAALPELTATPATLTFNAGDCGPATGAQAVSIAVSGGASRSFTATPSGAPWLRLNGGTSAVTGSTPTTLSVSVVPGSLTSGVYTASIAITAPDVTNSPRTVTVTLNVSTRALLVAPVSLGFTAAAGGASPATQNVSISTSCQDAHDFTATRGAPWLRLNGGTAAVSGSTPASVAVGIDASGLAPGVHSALVTIDAPGLSGSPRTVEVTLTVTSAALPELTASPATLTFNAGDCGPATGAQAVSIAESGGASRTFTATPSGAPWLRLNGGASAVTGSTPATLSVSVVPGSLTSGVYTASIAITAPDVANSPRTVSVALNVVTSGIAVDPSSLIFTVGAGDPPPASQRLAVTACGPALSFTASAASQDGWLSVAPSGGSTPGEIQVSANPAGLAPGTYIGSVTITAPGAPNSPRAIPVTLQVLADVSECTLVGNPAVLIFTATIGEPAPAPRQVAVSCLETQGVPFEAAPMVATPPSGGWLRVEGGRVAVRRVTTASLSVGVSLTGLPAGEYQARVRLRPDGVPGTPGEVLVRLIVNACRPAVDISPASLDLAGPALSGPPARQTIRITSPGPAQAALFPEVITPTGAAWLSTSPSSGLTPFQSVVTADSTQLTPGNYEGLIRVRAPCEAGGALGVRVVPVHFSVTAGTPGGPSLDPVILPDAIIGQDYSAAIPIRDGSAPYRATIVRGSLPDGPENPPALRLAASSEAEGPAAAAGFVMEASGRSGAALEGPLNDEIQLGRVLIRGIPQGPARTYRFRLKVVDANGLANCVDARDCPEYRIRVLPRTGPPTTRIVTYSPLPCASLGSGYFHQLQAVAPPGAILTWSQTGLPDGFTLDRATGEIRAAEVSVPAGTVLPLEVLIRVRVTAMVEGQTLSDERTLTLVIQPPDGLRLELVPLDTSPGQTPALEVVVRGGRRPYQVEVVDGLPDGIEFLPDLNRLVGEPLVPGIYRITFRVTSGSGEGACAEDDENCRTCLFPFERRFPPGGGREEPDAEPNQPPVAEVPDPFVSPGTPVRLLLLAVDPDRDPLYFALDLTGLRGTLSRGGIPLPIPEGRRCPLSNPAPFETPDRCVWVGLGDLLGHETSYIVFEYTPAAPDLNASRAADDIDGIEEFQFAVFDGRAWSEAVPVTVINIAEAPPRQPAISPFPAPKVAPRSQGPLTISIPEPYILPIRGQARLVLTPAPGVRLPETIPPSAACPPVDPNQPVPVYDETVGFVAPPGCLVNFEIPAGETSARFFVADPPAPPVLAATFQTGTTAGVLKAEAVALSVRDLPLPLALFPEPQTAELDPAAPQISSARRTAVAGGAFEVTVEGYVTDREITRAEFTFTFTSGETVVSSGDAPGGITVAEAFRRWFQNPESLKLGSQFKYTQRFTLQGDATLRDVDVRFFNALGQSNQVRAAVQ